MTDNRPILLGHSMVGALLLPPAMKPKLLLLLLPLPLAACGTSTLDVNRPGEDDELADTTQLLGSRVSDEFGATARVQAMFGEGEKVLFGVATDALVPESDIVAPMAIASF